MSRKKMILLFVMLVILVIIVAFTAYALHVYMQPNVIGPGDFPEPNPNIAIC